MAKIAVGSTDGVSIDVHFGKAEFFDLYDISQDRGIFFSERRHIQSRSLENIVKQISDVDIVLIRFIGQHAADALERRKIVYAAVNLPVERALAAYAKRGYLLLDPLGQRSDFAEIPPRHENCPLRVLKGLN